MVSAGRMPLHMRLRHGDFGRGLYADGDFCPSCLAHKDHMDTAFSVHLNSCCIGVPTVVCSTCGDAVRADCAVEHNALFHPGQRDEK